MFTSLPSKVDLDSTAHGFFDALIASLPARNSQFISAKRFRRFMCILEGNTHETDHAQLKRHCEKLFNIREFGSRWHAHAILAIGRSTPALTCTRESIERPKHENKYKGGRQAMVPASECEVVTHKVHTHDGHSWQERTWNRHRRCVPWHITRPYEGIREELLMHMSA